MTLKRLLYEKLYFVYYSVKELAMDIVNLIEELKKPRMWSAILYATFFVAAYARNFKLMRWTLPLIFIIYLIRQKKERKYIGEMYEKDLRKSIDSDIVRKHYDTYSSQCRFAHKQPAEFNEWKSSEIKRLDEKNRNALNA